MNNSKTKRPKKDIDNVFNLFRNCVNTDAIKKASPTKLKQLERILKNVSYGVEK